MCVSSWHAVAAADGQLQAPRYTYLPLLIPEIRENLVDLVLDEEALEGVDEKDWWFEEEADQPAFAVQGACKWCVASRNNLCRQRTDTRHWPLDLIELYSIIAHPHDPTNAVVTPRPLRLVLHLKNPPSDKLLVPNSLEACKNHFVNSLKEADFVKWRNTNKVTSLRKVDLDAGWDGIVQGAFRLAYPFLLAMGNDPELRHRRLRPLYAHGNSSLAASDSVTSTLGRAIPASLYRSRQRGPKQTRFILCRPSLTDQDLSPRQRSSRSRSHSSHDAFQ
jgi:hypothetical protein